MTKPLPFHTTTVFIALFLLFPLQHFSQSWDWLSFPQSKKANWSTAMAVYPSGKAACAGVYMNDSLTWNNNLLLPLGFISEGGMPTDCYLLLTAGDSLNWIKRFGGIAEDYVSALDLDDEGNSYAAGYFADDLYIDNDTLEVYAPQGPYYDAFIIKHDSSGNLLWAKSIYGTWYEKAEDIHACSNGFLVSGNFNDSLYLDTIAILETGYWRNLFLARYDEAGQVQWAISSKGKYFLEYDEHISRIETDAYGNIYLSGHFTDSICFGSLTAYGNGGKDIFLASFDSLGNPRWLRSMGGSYNDYLTAMLMAADSFLYLTGNSRDTLWYDNQPFYTSSPDNVFYAKVNTAGDLVFINNSFSSQPSYGGTLATDNSGNIYAGLYFKDTVSFFDSVNASGYAFFLAKLRGDTLMEWAKIVEAGGNLYFAAWGSDDFGNLFSAGGYSQKAFFDSLSPDSSPVWNSFIAHLSCFSEPPLLTYPTNTICPGDSVTLFSSVKLWQTNQWASGETLDTIFASSQGIYSVSAYDDNACASLPASVEIIHFIPDKPLLARVCDSIFSQNSFNNVKWFSGDSIFANDTLYYIIAPDPGNYFFTADDSNGCIVFSDTINFFFPDSNVFIGRICDSFFVNDSYENYSWFLDSNLLPDSANSITAATNGNYFLIVVDSNFCSISSDSILYIKVDSLIFLNRFCDSLFAENYFGQYYWFYNGDSVLSNNQNFLIASINGLFSLSVVDSNGCIIPSDSISFIKADSVVNIGRKCDSLFVPEFYENFYWFLNQSLLTDTLAYLMADSNGAYSINVIDSNACSVISDFINYERADSIIYLERICDSIFTSGTYKTFQWFFDGALLPDDSAYFLIADQNGKLSLTVVDSNECTITSDSIEFVKADSIILLNRQCDSLYTDNSFDQYSWYYNGNPILFNQNYVIADSSGAYLVEVLDSNGCFIPSDTVEFFKADSIINIGRVCDSLYAPEIYSTYNWNFNGSLLDDSVFYLNADSNGLYTINVTDSFDCFIPSDSVFYIQADSTVFLGQICDSIYIENNYAQFLWFHNGNQLPGDSLNFFTASADGEYSATVVDSNGCSISSDSVIFIQPDSSVFLERICDSIFSEDKYILYNWYYNENLISQDSIPYIIATTEGIYSLSVSDSFGCSIQSDEITFYIRDSVLTLSQECDSLFLPGDYSKYFWYYNGNILPSDSLSYLIPGQNGIYHLVSLDEVSCVYYTDTVNVYISFRKASHRIFPNPVNHVLNVELSNLSDEKIILTLKSSLGKQILTEIIQPGPFENSKNQYGRSCEDTDQVLNKQVLQWNLNGAENGIYFLFIKSGDEVLTYKIVKL